MSRSPAKSSPAPKAATTMRKALSDPALLGNVLVGDSWRAWRVLLIALMGEPLDNEERAIFKGLTGREREPLGLSMSSGESSVVEAARAAHRPF